MVVVVGVVAAAMMVISCVVVVALDGLAPAARPLANGRRVSLGVLPAVPHKVRVQHDDPQTALRLLD